MKWLLIFALLTGCSLFKNNKITPEDKQKLHKERMERIEKSMERMKRQRPSRVRQTTQSRIIGCVENFIEKQVHVDEAYNMCKDLYVRKKS